MLGDPGRALGHSLLAIDDRKAREAVMSTGTKIRGRQARSRRHSLPDVLASTAIPPRVVVCTLEVPEENERGQELGNASE